jgi:hypothetical protein
MVCEGWNPPSPPFKTYVGLFNPNYYSAWSKSKSKEKNFGFVPKQNTKIPFKPPPPLTYRKLLSRFQARKKPEFL